MEFIEILTNPVVQGFIWTAVGLIVKAVCPAAVPLLGAGKALTNELVSLLAESEEDNKKIVERAVVDKYEKAQKQLINSTRFMF